jgi:hypothetical protein
MLQNDSINHTVATVISEALSAAAMVKVVFMTDLLNSSE